MRLRTGIALAVLMAGSGLLPAAAAHASVTHEAGSVQASAVQASKWVDVGWYDYDDDCQTAGLRGQNKLWWVTYRCMVMVPSKPGKPGVYPLEVKYHW
jgi:hypothetical protein